MELTECMGNLPQLEVLPEERHPIEDLCPLRPRCLHRLQGSLEPQPQIEVPRSSRLHCLPLAWGLGLLVLDLGLEDRAGSPLG